MTIGKIYFIKVIKLYTKSKWGTHTEIHNFSLYREDMEVRSLNYQKYLRDPQGTWNPEITASPTCKHKITNENGSRFNNLQKEEVGTTDVQTRTLQVQNGYRAGKKKARPNEAYQVSNQTTSE